MNTFLLLLLLIAIKNWPVLLFVGILCYIAFTSEDQKSINQ